MLPSSKQPGPARWTIVDELAECGERSLQELTARIGKDASAVARQLSPLKNAGVVASRKSETALDCRLRRECILVFLNCAEPMLGEKPKGRLAPGCIPACFGNEAACNMDSPLTI